MVNMMTKEELVRALQEYAAELGRAPSRDEMKQRVRGFQSRCQILGIKFSEIIALANVGPLRKTKAPFEIPEIVAPFIPADDIPVEDIISSMCQRFDKRKNAHEAKKWMEFKVDTDKPIGICTFGDPHIDDDGCNWPLLKEHIEICKNTPGMYGMNIGDTHNNWVGRLTKEYANQSTTRATAFKLIEWFFKDAGIRWLIMLLGNHDAWNFGTESMGKIAEHLCPMIDWRAQFVLKFSNGREVRIDAAHDHAGHSQWNSLHAQQKASSMGGIADVYIAGHKHNWAIAQNECPHTHRIYHLARARGYKHIDHYGENLGFGSQKYGSSVVIVIDPRASEVNKVRLFADPVEGAKYLTYLRSKI